MALWQSFLSLVRENSTQTWIITLVVFAAVIVALMLLRRILGVNLRRTGERRDLKWLEFTGRLIARTHLLVIGFVGLTAASTLLVLPFESNPMPRLMMVALLIQLGLWGHQGINFFLEDYKARRLETDAASVTTMAAAGFLVKLAFYSLILLSIVTNLFPDFEIGPLLAGVGVAGIAIGLALQNILSDLFASLSIVLDKPFVIGDFIIVGDMLGTVERIGLKTTRVRSLGGEQLIFSNNDLLQSRIRNYKRMQERRIVFGFGVVYQTTPDKLEAIPAMVRAIIEAQDRTRFDRAHFKAYGAHSLDFEVVYYVLSPDFNIYMDIQQAINLAIFRKFAEEGIEFAYPTQTLYLEKGGDAARA